MSKFGIDCIMRTSKNLIAIISTILATLLIQSAALGLGFKALLWAAFLVVFLGIPFANSERFRAIGAGLLICLGLDIILGYYIFTHIGSVC